MRTVVIWLFLSLFTPCLSFTQIEENYATVDEFQLFYRIYGKKGEPILIINGGPGFSSNYVTGVAEELSKRLERQVIIYDQRGTGKTIVEPITKRTINLRNSITDIEDLRTHLGIEKWDVLGHAFGGALACLYAKKFPEHIDRLILTSTVGLNLNFAEPMMDNLVVRIDRTTQDEISKIEQDQIQGRISQFEFNRRRLDLLVEAYVYDLSKLQEARDLIKVETDFNIGVNQVLWDQVVLSEFEITKDMAKFEHPVLVLHGRQDVLGESVAIYTQQAFPNSAIIFFNKAGRYLWLDQPEQFYESIKQFLK